MKKKTNPLSKAQNKLLKDSLQRLLGHGLLDDFETANVSGHKVTIQDAFNFNFLNDESTQSTGTVNHRIIKSEILKLP